MSCCDAGFVSIGSLEFANADMSNRKRADLLLAIADIGVVLIRGVIAVLVSLCDLLASCACCYRVPWDERPDRDTYTYSTVMKASAAQQHRRGPFWWATKQGRMEVKQEKAARKRQRQLE